MKKRGAFILAIVFIAGIVGMAFVGCSLNKNGIRPNGDNLATGATYTSASGEKLKTFSLTGNDVNGGTITNTVSASSEGDYSITVKLKSAVEFNTVILNEKTDTVSSFEIWSKNASGEELLYRQDEIGGMRYCLTKDVKTDTIVVKVTGARDKFTINGFELYKSSRNQGDFRITTYVPVWDFLEYKYDREGLKHVTDIILFGVATYNEKGELKTNNTNADGTPSINDEKIKQVISEIKELRGNNTARFYVNFVSSSDLKKPENVKGEKFFASVQKQSMKTNGATFINNLKNYVDKIGLDGIAFDYEFPYTLDDYSVYSNFLVSLKEAMPSKRISIAVAPWGLKFSKAAKKAVDMFEVMAYDLPDLVGNHSGWQNCAVDAIDYMVKNGYPKEKLDLGLAFYSRPVDYGSYWGSYSSEVDKLGQFGNYASDEFESSWDGKPFTVKARWYNGVNMIKDKTAYAFDSGIGGLMIWQYNCDLQYSDSRSLLRAINSVFS